MAVSEAPPQSPAKKGGGRLSFLTFALLRFSMFMIFIAACRLVPYSDFLCVLLASVYIYIMSRYAFPPVTPESPPSIYKGSKVLKIYVTFAAYVGLYLPLAYIAVGVGKGDKRAVKGAASHTFFLAAQVVSERLTGTSNSVSLPARALVPILYNSGRLVSVWTWVRLEFSKGTASSSSVSDGPLSAKHWVVFGQFLAVANLLFWSYNLFCFLVPIYLPACFRKYVEDERKNSERSKKVE